MNKTIRLTRRSLQFTALLVFATCAFLVFGHHTAFAAQASDAQIQSDLAPFMPDNLIPGIQQRCDYGSGTPQAPQPGWSAVQTQWLSEVNNSKSQNIPVNYKSTSVPLQLNYVTYRCNTDGNVAQGFFTIDSVLVGQPSDKNKPEANIQPPLDGTKGPLYYTSQFQTGQRHDTIAPQTVLPPPAPQQFSYFPAQPFTTEQTVTLSLVTRGTVQHFDGTYWCALTGAKGETEHQTGGAYDFNGCNQETDRLDIHITIKPQVSFIAGRIYSVDAGGGNVQTVAGLTVDICNNTEPNARPITTDSNGYWLAVVDKYSGFCARPGGALPTTWTEGPSTNNNVNGVPGGSSLPTYEWQVAGFNCSQYSNTLEYKFCGVGGIGGHDEVLTNDLNSNNDAQYNFRYIRHPPTCSITATPTNSEVGQAVTFTIGKSFLPRAGNQPLNYFIQATIPGIPGVQGSFDAAPVSYTTPPFNTAGTYQASATISGDGWTYTCNLSINVASKPYLKVFGNDIAAGGKFADTSTTTCSPGPTKANAGVWAFWKNTGSFYSGASSQFGIFALGKILGTASASNRGLGVLGDPLPPVGLSFGNMLPAGGGSVAANGAGNSNIYRCIPDYFSASASSPTPVPTGQVTINTTNTTIPAGTQKAVFVNGDALINNDITFGSDPTTGNGDWASPQRIPSYYLIVKGNIYISSNVHNLDGVYIAQPNGGAGGNIYTCTNGFALYAAAQLYSSCSNKLTVTGSFIANQVHYQRTRGTLDKSDAGGVNETPASDNIAEVFNFSQEMYLAPAPSVLDSVIGGSVKNRYDAITSLPPIL